MAKAGILLFFLCIPSWAQWKAGMARMNITPDAPIRMAGYAARLKPSEGAIQPLWLKALALSDGRNGRVIFITADLIGWPRALTDAIAAEAQKRWNLDRSALLFNASHTHSGPIVYPSLPTMFALPADDERVVRAYSAALRAKALEAIGQALDDLTPVRLTLHSGQAAFAVNRRERVNGAIRIGVNPAGPVDHAVPILRADGPGGKLRALLFGYACHNTTLTGQFQQLSGDYAGFAQSALESAHPGVMALFMALTGADQNPHPRSRLDLAKTHGDALAAAVSAAMATPGEPVKGRIRTALTITELPFAPHTREQFEAELKDKNEAVVRRARAMLQAYDERRPMNQLLYPVQAVRLGEAVTVVALAGEVVVDYALLLRARYPKARLVVAGYSNDLPGYIPSRRILAEGGYEAVESMPYFGLPGPFAPEVEDRVLDAASRVLRRVGIPGKP
jgi:hypothetical protein